MCSQEIDDYQNTLRLSFKTKNRRKNSTMQYNKTFFSQKKSVHIILKMDDNLNDQLIKAVSKVDEHPNNLIETEPIADQLKKVEDLILKGADVNYDDPSDRKTPLHTAAWNDNYQLLKLLLKYGADPNPDNVLGDSPLSFATLKSSADMVETLLQAGANPMSKDYTNSTPLTIATNKLVEVVQSEEPVDKNYKCDVRRKVELIANAVVNQRNFEFDQEDIDGANGIIGMVDQFIPQEECNSNADYEVNEDYDYYNGNENYEVPLDEQLNGEGLFF